jgi:putative protease
MELLAPAGNLEKLATAYTYGADAAYIGVRGFSLRAHADTLAPGGPTDNATTLASRLRNTKPAGRRLYAAMNLFAHREDLARLPDALAVLAELPIDGVILADIGLVEAVGDALPAVELHLSTQANCTNAHAAKLYRRLGFSRIVPARELSLDEVKEIKDAVPELEIEVFVHGAMCMAYSGRCFMSNVLAGRDANRGDCAQSCRWNYHLVEEKRPGEYITLDIDERGMAVLSARDLMLFDHLAALREAGVDALKIEGRMKSALYTATVTRSYRAALDVEGVDLNAHRAELLRISHREYTAGFLMGDRRVHRPSVGDRPKQYRLMGIVGEEYNGRWNITVKNTIARGRPLEFLPPDPRRPVSLRDDSYALFNTDGEPVERITNASDGSLACDLALTPGMVIRAVRD